MNEIIQQIKAHARQAQIQPQFAKDQAWEIEQLAEALQARVNVLEEALTAARNHLEFCDYGDSWESECAYAQGLPSLIEAALQETGQ